MVATSPRPEDGPQPKEGLCEVLRLFSSISLLAGLAAIAHSEPTFPDGAFADIEVRVYNYVPHSKGIVPRARAETDSFFADVGLAIRWVDCPTRLEEIALYPDCNDSASPLTLIVRLLPNAMARPDDVRRLGYALVGEHLKFPKIAAVLYDNVERLAFNRGIDAGVAVRALPHPRFMSLVIGRVMAHEISHLLGAKLHRDGLMEARLNAEAIREGIAGRCRLSSRDAKRVRAEIVRRTDAAEEAASLGG